MIAAGLAGTGAAMTGAYSMTDVTRPDHAKSVYDEVIINIFSRNKYMLIFLKRLSHRRAATTNTNMSITKIEEMVKQYR